MAPNRSCCSLLKHGEFLCCCGTILAILVTLIVTAVVFPEVLPFQLNGGISHCDLPDDPQHRLQQFLLGGDSSDEHPSIQRKFQKFLYTQAGGPNTHPNVDPYTTQNPQRLNPRYPSNHPNLDQICSIGMPCTNYGSRHPNVMDSIGKGLYPVDHPNVQSLFDHMLIQGHPDCDAALQANLPLPGNHPDIELWILKRPPFKDEAGINELGGTLTPGAVNTWESTDGNMRVEWQVVGNSIRFTMSSPQAVGWMSIGFSQNRLMSELDCYTGHFNGAAVVVEDQFSGDNVNVPKRDALQNVGGVSGSIINGRMEITFTRPIVSPDPNDEPLGTNYIVWATGTSVLPASLHARYGSSQFLDLINGKEVLAATPGVIVGWIVIIVLTVLTVVRWGYILLAYLGRNKAKTMPADFVLNEAAQRQEGRASFERDNQNPIIVDDAVQPPGGPALAPSKRATAPPPPPPPPPTPPAPASTGALAGGWACPTCTLDNAGTAAKCTVCGSPKPYYLVAMPSAQAQVVKPPKDEKPPGRDRMLQQSIHLHKAHKTEKDLYDYDEAEQEMRAHRATHRPTALHVKVQDETLGAYVQHSALFRTWIMVTRFRVPYTSWTGANLLILAAHVLLNVFGLFASQGGVPNSLLDGNKWGSLAAVNVMLIMLPATRNSLLTWALGLPFELVILYHRNVGRVALFCVLVHFLLYYDKFVHNPLSRVNIFGFLAFLCGLVIFLTSFDFMRRRHFEWFYWSHFCFLGFFGFGMLHVPQAVPFLAIGAFFYALDRACRVIWTLTPRRALVFRPKTDDITEVRFHKNPLSSALGRFKVGQYFFLNVPELSVFEWHPYSVSAGPREDSTQVHIRALGDHTTKLNELAARCAKEGRLPLVRADGPYGVHNFNYRRYPVIFMVGGGVGITPVMGILKDVCNVNVKSQAIPAHVIKEINVVWIMPDSTQLACFQTDLDACVEAARTHPMVPKLKLWLYSTQQKNPPPPLISGRPQFIRMFDQAEERHPNVAFLCFACGPDKMVAQLWDECLARTKAGTRYDFHHETFEF